EHRARPVERLAQHAGHGRLLDPRAERESPFGGEVVAGRFLRVSLELRQRERLLRSEPARAAGRREPERRDQYRRRPLQLHGVVRESTWHLSGAVGAADYAGRAYAVGPAVRPDD